MMYNNGVQDSELQLLHRKLGLNLNMFLPEILEDENGLFHIKETNTHYLIYPLFYCDRITSDGDIFVNGHYMVSVEKDFSSIILFITDNPVLVNPAYIISDTDVNEHLLFVYDTVTLQPLRNHKVTVIEDDVSKGYFTDELGYLQFITETSSFEVII